MLAAPSLGFAGPRWLVAALACLLLVAPAGARASSSQEALFMDDSKLVFGTDPEVEATFGVLRSLGVDRVRVDLLWHLVAPQSDSAERPAFELVAADDPAAYPSGNWDIYDRVVVSAARHGIEVLFTITGPSPRWASSEPRRDDKIWDPRPADFRDFVTAVGRRYSGTHPDEAPELPPPPGGLPILPPPPPPPTPPPLILPRVSAWSIWNEPNQPGWLRPQASGDVPVSPRLYRALQDAGYAGLVASGHGSDTYLLAETAPRGALSLGERTPMRPLLFIRELYCLDRRLRAYTGGAAAARGCPTRREARLRFSSEHPGLFQASGFAHHPYALEVPPARPDPIPDQVTLAVLPRLTKTLDRIFRRYGSRRRLPVWITEYGYQTNPPDPIVGISWGRQAAYINEAEYMAYRNPRVRSTSQFLLVDDGPNRNWPPYDVRYWGSTFQSGLVTMDGARKHAFDAYRLPVHVAPRRVRQGRAVTIFGGNRPAANGEPLRVAVEFRRRGTRTWATVSRVTTGSGRGYVLTRVRATAPGDYRLAWEGGGRSRSVAVTIVR